MVEEKEISVKEINQENQQEKEKAKWWIIRVKSGKEDLVKAEIEKLAQQESKIKEVFTPEEEQKVKRKDKKGEEKEVLIKKKLISGYVYVKMELDEQLWNKKIILYKYYFCEKIQKL
jgi:transcription antitermination factor NusG